MKKNTLSSINFSLISRIKLRFITVALILLALCACNPLSPSTHIEKVQKRGDIIMGTINGSLTYSYDGETHSGFDYELAKQFSEYLDVRLTIKEYDTLNELFKALDKKQVDFIGSGLTLTPKRSKKYRSSPPYYYVSQKVVYHKGTYRPREVADINAPVSVIKDSSHEETLLNLLNEAPELEINILEYENQETLLRQIANKQTVFAIIDSSTLAQKQRFYPVLAEAFTISEKQPVAWLINRDLDDSIYSAMIEFIGNKYQDQTIAKLEEKYFGHVEHFDFVDIRTFLKRIKTTLPNYEALFKQYATPEVDWLLLAAVSYQESHWNPNAKSPTGVRGLMMLTLDTAEFVGIKNRLDPEQSIHGGAKYLSQQINRLPDSIPDNEKVWFALASYNIGYGHLMDARRITSMKKQNPNSWADVKENLPLLHQKKWYKKTRYGYARGREAQHYVNNIRQYQKSLTWFITEREKQQAKIEAQKIAKDQAIAAKIAFKKAQQKRFAEEQNWQTPLSTEQVLQFAEQNLEENKKRLQQAKQENEAIEQKLLQAKEKTQMQKDSLQVAQQKLQTLQNELQQVRVEAIAEQNALELAKEKALAKDQELQFIKQQLETEVQALQQAKNDALAKQRQYQQAQEKALAMQAKALKAEQEALLEMQALLEIQEAENKVEPQALNENNVSNETN